ncbi:hypothetical protein RF11_13708 [Thelohanellus kitauei]|uniref:Uncharacterized protein n=1 Tax=Thelohanellus kitauei TaxID=669202 RepID=A0A0C2MPI6_THEKT|nr:hypothetical protein RF11_13708 [Thelohanellus kitauei]
MSRYVRYFGRFFAVGSSLAVYQMYIPLKEKYERFREEFKIWESAKERFSKIGDFFLESKGALNEVYDFGMESYEKEVRESQTIHSDDRKISKSDIETLDETQLRGVLREVMDEVIQIHEKYRSKIKILQKKNEELQNEIDSLVSSKIKKPTQRV